MEEIKDFVGMIDRPLLLTVIERYSEPLKQLSHQILQKPETSYKETFAHKILTEFLEKEGFDVEKHFICPTGFRAIYSFRGNQQNNGAGPGDGPHVNGGAPTAVNGELEISENALVKTMDSLDLTDNNSVCLICNYDALPELGHATGHNLGTVVSIAVALAVKQHLQQYNITGKVVVLGTPGEDGGGGKIDMLDAGVFNDISFCVLPTPMEVNIVCPMNYSLIIVSVTYEGKPAHASASPWEGKNALDAAVACYNNVALLRQQLKPSWTVNGIIKHGGVQANIIPDKSALQFYIRAPNERELVILQQRVVACFHSAAKATGCEVHYEYRDKPVYSLWHNSVLADNYAKLCLDFGMEFTDDLDSLIYQCGSSDMGNVSHTVPCLCPAYDIGTTATRNTPQFTEAAGTDIAHEKSMDVAKVLAATTMQAMADPVIMKQIIDSFHQQTAVSQQPRSRYTSSSLSDLRQSLSRTKSLSQSDTRGSSLTDLQT